MDPQAVNDAWVRSIQAVGEQGTLRRKAHSVADVDATVWVKSILVPTRGSDMPLAGASVSTRRRYLILFEDIGAWPLPIKKNDLLIVAGRTMTVIVVDDVSRRMSGRQMAIEVEVSGA